MRAQRRWTGSQEQERGQSEELGGKGITELRTASGSRKRQLMGLRRPRPAEARNELMIHPRKHHNKSNFVC